MKQALRYQSSGLNGKIICPSDKSISHRAALLGAIAKDKTVIHRYLQADDTLTTLTAIETLGATVKKVQDTITIIPVAKWHNTAVLDLQNSGTTMRLLSGILAGKQGTFTLKGDNSLNKRPMKRIIDPLEQMGATIKAGPAQTPPLQIIGQKLHGISYTLPIPSAQVKSAIMLAGLQAEGITSITEPIPSRNHTEEILPLFGGTCQKKDDTWIVPGEQTLYGTELTVPSDFSSAAFWMVTGILVPNSCLTLPHIPINPTRDGLRRVIQQMGGEIEQIPEHDDLYTLICRTQALHATTIKGDIIPTMIDELPLVALLATQAEGTTIIKDAQELRVKETDRIMAITTQLNALGACITPTEDGMIINGPTPLHGGDVNSFGDHRIGMMLGIASLLANEPVMLHGAEVISVSYPDFFKTLNTL